MPRVVTIHTAHPRLQVDRPALRRVIHVLDSAGAAFGGGPPPGELSLALLTDPALAKLHHDFLGDATPTDVITFGGEAGFGSAGEICVSVDQAASFARAHQADFSRELTLYVVHGWLHLAGYDDVDPLLKRRMRAAEARAMRLIEDAGVRPAFSLKPGNRQR